MWIRLLTIVLQPAAQEAADRYLGVLHRFGDAWDALQWLLARMPEQGLVQEVGGTSFRLYAQASDPLARTPEIWIVFSFNDTEVVVYDLFAREFKDDHDDD